MEWPALDPAEFELDDPDERLWRQVHPQYHDNGVLSSQAFRPNSGDNGLLSTSREQKQTAVGAYEFHVNEAKLQSDGTWAVTVGEVVGQSCRALDDGDAVLGRLLPPGHTSIDMRAHGSSGQRKIGTALSRLAARRGRFHPPE
jgi:hypothetical protein